MKVSLNLAQLYSNVDLKSMSHHELEARVGSQLGAIEETIEYSPKYDGIVVVKVVSVSDHPNADRLHVCLVDDGGKIKQVARNEKGLVQVVCGAPNVREGMFVAWIPPMATVPSTFGTQDPFVLDARELRGVKSNGMLASAKELGISDDHDGILEIDPAEVGSTPKTGEPLTKYFGLDDFVIDCENKMFTHRPDCFGNLGVARELAGISDKAFKSPSWYFNKPDLRSQISGVKLNVKNEAGKKVPRLMSVAMTNVHVGKSPVWMQAALSRVGIKSINNVVDITNYVMHITGQPLHAYDADKLQGSIITRMAKKGEKVALLSGKTIELAEEDIVIANETQIVGLAGIMGGSETEVDDNTTDIIIECATFDMYTIRRSSMRHGLFTDASTRYTKGQSPLQNDRVLNFAMKLLEDLAAAKQASQVYDVHGSLKEPEDVVINAEFINERLGTKLSLKDIARLLENVEFTIKTVPADKNRLHIRPPFWRTDIELPEDIVEEIGRLHGYDKLDTILPPRSAKPSTRNGDMDKKAAIRSALSGMGANEVLSYSFVHGNLMEKVGQNLELAYHLRNALSPDLQYYRLSLTPSLLDKVRGNIRSDMVRSDDNEFALFEIGKSHIKGLLDDEKVPEEINTVAFVFAADDKTVARKYEGSAFYVAKKYLETLAPKSLVLELINELPQEEFEKQKLAPFEIKRSAFVKLNGKHVGFIGEIKSSIKKSLKLPDFCAAFEIDISLLGNKDVDYEPISQFPKTQQDITLEVDSSVSYQKVYDCLKNGLDESSIEHGYIPTLWPRDIYQAEGSDKKRYSYRMWLSHPVRTLTTEETNRLLDNLANEAKNMLNAERI